MQRTFFCHRSQRVTGRSVLSHVGLSLVLLLFTGCGGGSDQTAATSNANNDASSADPETDLVTQEVHTAIEEMLAAVESRGTRALIESYTAEQEVDRLRSRGQKSYEAQIKMLESELLTHMITEFLTAVLQSKPKFDDSRKEATLQMQFANDAPDEPPVAISAELDTFGNSEVSGFGDDLDIVLQKAIEVLQDDESIFGPTRNFAENMFPIGELQHPVGWQLLSRKASLADRVDRSPELLEQMIVDFKQMQQIPPQYEQDGRLAIFVLRGSTDASTSRTPDRQIRMELIDGNWRLFDNTKPAIEEVSKWSNHPLSNSEELSRHMPFIRLRKTDSGWKLDALPKFR